MMSNDKLAQIAYEFDDYLAKTAIDQGVDVLALTAIFLARLLLCNDAAGSGNHFRTICGEVSQYNPRPFTAPNVH